MFAQYFEYYAIILRGAVFCGHSVYIIVHPNVIGVGLICRTHQQHHRQWLPVIEVVVICAIHFTGLIILRMLHGIFHSGNWALLSSEFTCVCRTTSVSIVPNERQRRTDLVYWSLELLHYSVYDRRAAWHCSGTCSCYLLVHNVQSLRYQHPAVTPYRCCTI